MSNQILSTGKNIRNSQDEQLARISVDQVHSILIDSAAPLVQETTMIRKVNKLDSSASGRLKTRLPFFCASHFKNGLRKMEFLEQSNGMIIDLDHLQKTPEEMNELLQRFRKDERISLFYISPSGTGLKLLFEFREPITEVARYTQVYKQFATSFALQYDLRESLDTKTSDPTRVSFLCHDPQAWFNPIPIPLDINLVLPSNSYHQLSLLPEQEALPKINPLAKSNELSASHYSNILKSMQPERPARAPKQLTVPSILNELMVHVQAQAALYEIKIHQVEDINYGKKIVFLYGADLADVNLFYGKKGFTIVKTPKRGSNPQLAEVGEFIIRMALSQPAPTIEQTH